MIRWATWTKRCWKKSLNHIRKKRLSTITIDEPRNRNQKKEYLVASTNLQKTYKNIRQKMKINFKCVILNNAKNWAYFTKENSCCDKNNSNRFFYWIDFKALPPVIKNYVRKKCLGKKPVWEINSLRNKQLQKKFELAQIVLETNILVKNCFRIFFFQKKIILFNTCCIRLFLFAIYFAFILLKTLFN